MDRDIHLGEVSNWLDLRFLPWWTTIIVPAVYGSLSRVACFKTALGMLLVGLLVHNWAGSV